MTPESIRALFRADHCPCGGAHFVLRILATGHHFGPIASRDDAEGLADAIADMVSSYGPMIAPMFGVDLDPSTDPAVLIRAVVGESNAPQCPNPHGKCPGGCL